MLKNQTIISIIIFFVLLFYAGIIEAQQEKKDETILVLSHNSFWRCFYWYGIPDLSPKLLKSVGEEILGKRLQHRCMRGGTYAVGGEGPRYKKWESDPPPSGWAAFDFNDTSWPRCPKPDYMGTLITKDRRIRSVYFRGRFEVTDPSTAGTITLRITYRGGIRAMLNGKEITRKHLPKGDLAPDTIAEDYPVEAYIVLDDEFTPDFPKKKKYNLWPEVPSPSSFEKLQKGPGPKDKEEGRRVVNRRYSPGITRKTLERLGKARNRVLTVTLPPGMIKKGKNLLALEVRRSGFHPVVWAAGMDNGKPRVVPWYHCMVSSLELKASGSGVTPYPKKPQSFQVWVEDMHKRVFSSEFLEPGAETGRIRIAGARNGTFSAQIVAASDKEIKNLTVSCSPLTARNSQLPPGRRPQRAGGDTRPSISVSISMVKGFPLKEMYTMGIDDYDHKPRYQVWYAVRRYGTPSMTKRYLTIDWNRVGSLGFFDQLNGSQQGDVPAGTCRPVWISFRIPEKAKPGMYHGTLKVEAQGIKPVDIPVQVEVIDWRIPDPKDFDTIVAAEQVPYGVAKKYGVKLWSDMHFELMEKSFKQMARLGNDWLFVPVLSRTEFGNYRNSPIKWIMKKNGTLAFDYTIMDRYLDLAVKHWGVPKIISFVIMHGNPVAESEVEIFNETTGKTETFNLGVDHMEDKPDIDEEHRKVWKAFAVSLYNHMKSRKLEKSIYWGFSWDCAANKKFREFLKELLPDVYWTRGGHFARADTYYKALTQCYGFRPSTKYGWQCPTISLANSRRGWFDAYVGCAGVDTQFMFRLWPEQALRFGHRGIGRIGVDYWGIWRQGCEVLNMNKSRGRTKGTVAYAINSILWPGKNGAESSTRMEALVEGLQETEARIFLEKALESKKLSKELTERIHKLFKHRDRSTWLIISSSGSYQNDCTWQGWQDRSRELYKMAAEVDALLKKEQ
jgi:hypothetical protein